jgi:hypothetical protein
MNANELRLNNLIEINGFVKDGELYINSPNIEKWQEAELSPWLLSKILSMRNLKADADISLIVRPIPLNEEWLERFGFQKEEVDVPALAKYNDWWLGEFRVFSSGTEAGYENEIHYKNFYFRVESVHQLQNLYYALNKKELEFSLALKGNK